MTMQTFHTTITETYCRLTLFTHIILIMIMLTKATED